MNLLIGDFENRPQNQTQPQNLTQVLRAQTPEQIEEKILNYCRSFSEVQLAHLAKIFHQDVDDCKLPESVADVKKLYAEKHPNSEPKSKNSSPNNEKMADDEVHSTVEPKLLDYVFGLIVDGRLKGKIDMEKGTLVMSQKPKLPEETMYQSMQNAIDGNKILAAELVKAAAMS